MIQITKITILGTGVLGSQIAYQTAYSGFDVVAYDINEEALTAAKKRLAGLAANYKEQVKGASEPHPARSKSSTSWGCTLRARA